MILANNQVTKATLHTRERHVSVILHTSREEKKTRSKFSGANGADGSRGRWYNNNKMKSSVPELSHSPWLGCFAIDTVFEGIENRFVARSPGSIATTISRQEVLKVSIFFFLPAFLFVLLSSVKWKENSFQDNITQHINVHLNYPYHWVPIRSSCGQKALHLALLCPFHFCLLCCCCLAVLFKSQQHKKGKLTKECSGKLEPLIDRRRYIPPRTPQSSSRGHFCRN